MVISEKQWNRYVNLLRKISDTAAEQMKIAINQFGIKNNRKLIEVAFALLNKYGEASGALAAEMYDQLAAASKVLLPPAEIADLPSIGETAKAVNGTLKTGNPDIVCEAVWRLVKRTAADTTLKNAIRDNAQWAWVPRGDSCAFCITLASRGWQYTSDEILKGGHAEHIHSNCDCNFCVRFNADTEVSGYDPDKYLEQYMEAPGQSSKAKINAMRRAQYEADKDAINERRRENYAKKKEREQGK